VAGVGVAGQFYTLNSPTSFSEGKERKKKKKKKKKKRLWRDRRLLS